MVDSRLHGNDRPANSLYLAYLYLLRDELIRRKP
jgi:hypothetical protein